MAIFLIFFMILCGCGFQSESRCRPGPATAGALGATDRKLCTGAQQPRAGAPGERGQGEERIIISFRYNHIYIIIYIYI